ncbi:MAG TPA: NTP transferase domain-containing protein [Polyangiaceae bacterium]|jgi:NDP-sugar pyrophosphorylase family protein
MQAVVLAGGLASRLGARSAHIPKSLLPIAGKPFVDWQLATLARAGFSRVLLCIGHLGEQIRAYCGSGARWQLALEYAEDGPRLLGTAGALRRALTLLDPEFLVTYGDSYLPFDYSAPLRDLRAHPEADGVMSVFKNDGAWDKSNTEVAAERVLRYEKNGADARLDHIDYGAVALRRKVIEALEPNVPLGLDQVQHELARSGTLRAYLAPERFYEIGSELGIAELERKLSEPR